MDDLRSSLSIRGFSMPHADGSTTFGVKSRYRSKAREACVRWDWRTSREALHCEEPHPWLDPTKLGTLSRTAEKHAQANTDCNGPLVPD